MLRALALVDTGAISRNVARLKASLAEGTALCAVVKANGYGHGDVASARAALEGGANWLGVATAEEAASLRAGGIDGPILILGAISEEELPVALEAGADVCAWREAFVRRLARNGGGVGVHVKLDTGMGRLGTRDAREATRVAEAVESASGLLLAGAMTHFATSDDDPEFMAHQLEIFIPWAERIRARNPAVLLHTANSAATLREPAAHMSMVRCGIAVYGMDPFHFDPAEQDLEPAMTLTSYVAEVKSCAEGESCGYGRRFVSEHDTWIATLPIGYGDGVRRALTNNADVLIAGRRFPLVGAVSMDNVTVDLGPSEDEPPLRGEQAVLIGSQDGEQILAEEWAERLGTINYEITCGISARVPRAYA